MQAQSCLNMLRESRASQTLSKALKGMRDATLLPKDAPMPFTVFLPEFRPVQLSVSSWVVSEPGSARVPCRGVGAHRRAPASARLATEAN